MRQGSLIAAALVALLAAAAPARASNDPLYPQQWGMAMIEADGAHQVAEGQGATIAVVDTGANFSHPDLAGRLVAGHDFVDGDDNPTDEDATDHHGTHVSGIVAADANNGVGVEGVAPQAHVLVVRVLDQNGMGSVENVASGIDYARTHGAQVINLSLGANTPLVGDSDSTLSDAMQRALDAGIVVVAAAGNDMLPFCEQPSSLHGPFMCVAAVDRQGQRSFYSSFSGFGSGYAISAPGGSGNGGSEDILSTVGGSGYDYEAGTSQATPHVSGVAGLLVSLGLRGQAVVDRIEQTATDAGPPGPDPIYGAGIVNARAAVVGLSQGGGGAGAAATRRAGAAARVSVPRIQRIRTVLRHGLVVRCLAAGGGRCSANANARRRRIAAGSHRLTIGRWVTVHAFATRRGRAMLLAALRGHRRIVTTVLVRLPGAPLQVRRVILKP